MLPFDSLNNKKRAVRNIQRLSIVFKSITIIYEMSRQGGTAILTLLP